MVLASWTLLIKPIICKEDIIAFPLAKSNIPIKRLAKFSLSLISDSIMIKKHELIYPFIEKEVTHVTYTNDKIPVPILCTSIDCDSIVVLSQIGVFNIKISITYIYFPPMGEVSISWIQKSTDMKTNNVDAMIYVDNIHI